MLRVQNSDMEFLDRQILKPRPEYLVDIARTAHWNSILTIFGGHSPAKLESCMNGNGTRITDAVEGGDCRDGL